MEVHLNGPDLALMSMKVAFGFQNLFTDMVCLQKWLLTVLVPGFWWAWHSCSFEYRPKCQKASLFFTINFIFRKLLVRMKCSFFSCVPTIEIHIRNKMRGSVIDKELTEYFHTRNTSYGPQSHWWAHFFIYYKQNTWLNNFGSKTLFLKK